MITPWVRPPVEGMAPVTAQEWLWAYWIAAKAGISTKSKVWGSTVGGKGDGLAKRRREVWKSSRVGTRSIEQFWIWISFCNVRIRWGGGVSQSWIRRRWFGVDLLIGCLPLVQLVEEKRCRFRLRGTWRRGLWTNLRDKPTEWSGHLCLLARGFAPAGSCIQLQVQDVVGEVAADMEGAPRKPEHGHENEYKYIVIISKIYELRKPAGRLALCRNLWQKPTWQEYTGANQRSSLQCPGFFIGFEYNLGFEIKSSSFNYRKWRNRGTWGKLLPCPVSTTLCKS